MRTLAEALDALHRGTRSASQRSVDPEVQDSGDLGDRAAVGTWPVTRTSERDFVAKLDVQRKTTLEISGFPDLRQREQSRGRRRETTPGQPQEHPDVHNGSAGRTTEREFNARRLGRLPNEKSGALLTEPFWTENRKKKLARTAQCLHERFLRTATIRQELCRRFEENSKYHQGTTAASV